jgi:hypothetical protein
MQTNPMAEWQRLTKLYGEMSDGELLDLSSAVTDLTEIAQQVLHDEMRKRKLNEPNAQISAMGDTEELADSEGDSADEQHDEDEEELEEDELPCEYTWKTLLCECDTWEEAWQIHEVLKRGGIDCWIEGARPGSSLEEGIRRVLVAADQLDMAEQIASRPIPREIIKQSKVRLPDFTPPACPICGTRDPVLEGIDPANRWRCENCGNEWSDASGDAEPT